MRRAAPAGREALGSGERRRPLPLPPTACKQVSAVLAELYVAWTPQQGPAVPEVVAELRAATPTFTGAVALLFAAARELFDALRGRRPQRPALPPASEQPAEQPKPAS